MTPLGIIIIVLCILVGLIIGKVISQFFPNLFSRDKKMREVMKDPYLLLEKLKAHGDIYDMGKKLELKVGKDSETGQDVVMVEEKEVKRAREIQKKIIEKPKKKELKTKKKVKKVRKKGTRKNKKQ